MELLGDIPGVQIICNDLLVAAHDEAEHDIIFRTVLERAKRYNDRFNRDKLQFKVEKIKYVGLQIAVDGIRPDPDKVSAIVNMATPTDEKAVQSFLGTVTNTCQSLFQTFQLSPNCYVLLLSQISRRRGHGLKPNKLHLTISNNSSSRHQSYDISTHLCHL